MKTKQIRSPRLVPKGRCAQGVRHPSAGGEARRRSGPLLAPSRTALLASKTLTRWSELFLRRHHRLKASWDLLRLTWRAGHFLAARFWRAAGRRDGLENVGHTTGPSTPPRDPGRGGEALRERQYVRAAKKLASGEKLRLHFAHPVIRGPEPRGAGAGRAGCLLEGGQSGTSMRTGLARLAPGAFAARQGRRQSGARWNALGLHRKTSPISDLEKGNARLPVSRAAARPGTPQGELIAASFTRRRSSTFLFSCERRLPAGIPEYGGPVPLGTAQQSAPALGPSVDGGGELHRPGSGPREGAGRRKLPKLG